MSFDSFLTRRGFSHDPFATTNAEQEDRLADYFVPPPYFESVLGNPATPKSNVIFAPRGSGKTAQRLMIERTSLQMDSRFLCLTYDNFESATAKGATLAAHQIELCRLLTLGVLTHLEDDTIPAIFLTDHERQIIKVAGQSFLSGLSAGEFQEAMKAVKTLGDKAGEFWKKYGGVVAIGVALLMKKVGLDDVDISASLEQQASDKSSASARYFLEQLLAVAAKLGWDSVYFLIDKVDETPATTMDADAAYKLIAQLVLDLPTIELPGAAFKFFFWDRMESGLRGSGLRADRMEVVKLRWTVNELSDMLGKRLGAYSNGTVTSFNQLLSSMIDYDVQLLLAHLSHGSPRDAIRMARAIVAEHTRMGDEPDSISWRTVMRGILNFSKEVTSERYPQLITDFSRVAAPSFTLKKIASGVFKISAPGANNKVQGWMNAGAVRQLGTQPNPGKKPLNLYGFVDLRTVLSSTPIGDVQDVLEESEWECPACRELIVVGEAEFDCPECGESVQTSGARNLLEVCALNS
ncbi:hypothetical protein Q0F99_19960 [Rathayibacter oskolensis]|uniref:P-loop ATPase, Sll1717 family n=1 Tax=Rathayibacter oskolensis TaxID=1891671 RepID=UPI00265E1D83|nr:hypothetical protein [Rathayibacter oskolensis]WKK71569.1 hypothetical protein Q0F99_19960 [Rathayibacter oskolensis]